MMAGLDEGSVLGAELARASAEALRRSWDSVAVRRAATADLVSLWRLGVNEGWLHSLASEEDGGLGLDVCDVVGFVENLGAHLIPGPWVDTMAVRAGVPGLSGLVPDDAMISLVGFDRASSRPTLSVHEGGPARVSGESLAGECADLAGWHVLAAARDEGCVLVLTHGSTDGLAVSAIPCVGQVRRLSELSYHDVECRVVAEGAGVASRLAWLRSVLHGMRATGLMRALMEHSRDYVVVREQFGRPVGQFQAVQHRLAEAHMRADLSRTLVSAVVRQPGDDQRLKAAEAYWSSALRYVAESALQVHGGIAFTEEFDLQLYVRAALDHQSVWGGRRHTLRELGEEVLAGLPESA